jgi:PAS domain S-box-containing protein
MTETRSEARIEPVDILLVDDRPENLTALISMLDQPGYRLSTATSGSEALKLVLKELYAVIVLDVVMPIMDGFEVAALIKARERSRHIPIIFLTAVGVDLDRIHEAYELGAVDYLMKPVPPHVLRAKVSVFVELYRKTEEVKRQAELLREHDRRERERQLAELKAASDRRYRDLAEAIPQLVWRANADGSVNYLSQRWREYTGMGDDQSEGWGWLRAIHPEDGEALRALWLSSIGAGTGFQAECRVRSDADHTFRWHLCQALPERDPTGAVIGWLGTYTDVDAQKRADEERAELLRRAERARAEAEQMQRRWAVLAEVSRLLNESLDYAVPLANVARHLAETVSRGCVIELLDESYKVVPVAVAHRDAEEEKRLRGTAGTPRGPSTRLLLLEGPKSGGARLDGAVDRDAPPLSARSQLDVPVEARGRVVGAISLLAPEPGWTHGSDDIAFAKDIGQRVAMFVESARLYDKAQRAIGARDEFLSIASHELRTPVTSLKLQIQLLARSLRGEGRVPFSVESAATKVEIAERQIERLATLIAALLDVSRIGAGQLIIDVRDMDLSQLTRDVAVRFADSCAVDGSSIAIDADEPVMGRWDPMRLEQVITNLLANALKYGPGSPIEVTVREDGSRAFLTVKDHGIGIAAENLGRIFDRFERAVSPNAYGGLGLGLYITRHLVTAHGGSIDVVSEPGAGAEFRVTLPLDAGAPA